MIFNQNLNIYIQENTLKMSSAKWRPFCLGIGVLINGARQHSEGQYSHDTCIGEQYLIPPHFMIG